MKNYTGDLNVPTSSEVRLAGQYVRPGSRAWKPSPVRDEAMRAHVFERDNWMCQECGRTQADLGWRYGLELDHIKPYKSGGYFIESNLRVLCQPCNIRKGAKWEGN